MNPIQDFRLTCCRLMQEHPLIDYRVSGGENAPQKLYVLLIGYGSRMATLLGEVMTQGQLLDTDLDITVVNTNARGTYESLLKRAPYLPHFVRILVDFQSVSEPEEKDRLCTLRFDTAQLTPETIPQILEERIECNYILISTGDSEKNRILAESAAQSPSEQKRFIGYIQKKGDGDTEFSSPMSEVHGFYAQREDAYRQQLECVAFNLHYLYSKHQNERIRYEDIAREFEEPYTYTSNIEAALHIRAKLACCSILDDDPAIAAAKFAKRIELEPKLIERLQVLEHRRWMLSKLLDGYRQMESVEQIYRNHAGTHSSTGKWHCCLVSCDPTGKSKLCDADWEHSAWGIRQELDDLDRVTLQIHEQCRIISERTAGQVDDLIHMIQKNLLSGPEYSSTTYQLAEELELAIVQMRQHKQSAIPRYYAAMGDLKTRVLAEGTQSDLLLRNLDSLATALLPLIAFISRKDYKEQDRILVQQIPFALTHKPQPVLIKILSERGPENMFSLWQLEPKAVIFLGCAFDATELLQLQEQVDNLKRNIDHAGFQTAVTFYLCVPAGFTKDIGPDVDVGSDVRLGEVAAWTLECLAQTLSPILRDASADYMDITGGEPLLTRAAEVCAARLGISSFYLKSGKMHSLQGGQELAYLAPVKGVTVQEMFEWSGAVLKKSKPQKLGDLSTKYRQLWEIESAHKGDWGAFCRAVAEAYKNTPKTVGSFLFRPAVDPTESADREIKNISAPAVAAILPELRKMEQLGYLKELSIAQNFDRSTTILFQVNAQYASPQKLEGFLRKCCYAYQPWHCYSFTQGDRLFVCEELQVQDMPTVAAGEGTYEYRFYKILIDLNRNGFIRSYWADQETNTCKFQFASKDVLDCLCTEGAVLESFLYYTALLDTQQFTDVDMGLTFLHSNETGSAMNELDVLCTKGLSSLFISAKLRGQKFFEENLNYVVYEISLLAEKFGINPKAVLAAPALDQFRMDSTGEVLYNISVENALRRGVYLLGRECFTDSKTLGEILNNIMDGKTDWCGFLKPLQ